MSFSTVHLRDVAASVSEEAASSKGRQLILYLHDDRSVGAHVFCSQVLCDQQVVNHLDGSAVLWPWDVTMEENYPKSVS